MLGSRVRAPEGVQKRRTRVLLFFCINTLGLALIYGGIRQNQTPPQHLLNLSEPKEILREPKIVCLADVRIYFLVTLYRHI